MRPTKPHGMIMAPANGGGGGEGSPPERQKRPSGMTHPVVKSEATMDTPVPVVLTHRTLLKLTAGIVGPLTVIIFGVALFYHSTSSHIDDPTIHLKKGERPKLQTKQGCSKNMKKLTTEIKREVRLNHKEAVVQQKEEIQKVGKELEQTQRQALSRILSEVRQGHRTTRRAIRSGTGRPAPASRPAAPID